MTYRERNHVLLSTLCALLVTLLAVTAPVRGAASDPMNMIPRDALFCVRVNSLDGALGQVDMFLAGLMPMGVSMMAKAQLGQMVGSADLQGIDTTGTFALFGPLPGGDAANPMQIGLLVPISNYQTFVSGNANVSAPDASGISKIGQGDNSWLIATEVGGYALVSTAMNQQAVMSARQSLASATSGLASTLDSAEAQRAKSSPVWAYANIQMVGQMFGAMIKAQLQQITQTMGAMQGQANMQQAQNVMAMYGSVLDSLLEEGQYVSLSLEPSGEKIAAAIIVAGRPGTQMAEALQGGSSPQRDNRVMQYLDDGAMMNIIGSADAAWNSKMNEFFLDLLPQMVGGEMSEADMTELKQMAADATDAMTGSLAGSFSVTPGQRPPFSFKYAVGLKDPQKFYDVLGKASKMMESGPLAEFYEGMGLKSFEFQRGTETYKDVSIDTMQFAIETPDASDPASQMVAQMYGEGLTIKMGVVDGLLLYAMSAEPGDLLHQMIDHAKAGTPAAIPSGVRTAMGLIEGAGNADFFVTYNVARAMQFGMAMAGMPAPQTPSQSAVAIAGSTDDGKMMVRLAVPKQHVSELMGIVMQMQMQQMQQQQQN
jgi:hypothetical protein